MSSLKSPFPNRFCVCESGSRHPADVLSNGGSGTLIDGLGLSRNFGRINVGEEKEENSDGRALGFWTNSNRMGCVSSSGFGNDSFGQNLELEENMYGYKGDLVSTSGFRSFDDAIDGGFEYQVSNVMTSLPDYNGDNMCACFCYHCYLEQNEYLLEKRKGQDRICSHGKTHVKMPLKYSPFELDSLFKRSVEFLIGLQGSIYLLAQDYDGCMLLQKFLKEGSERQVHMIYREIIDRVLELMLHPIANYMIQKLLDVCNENQRMQIVSMATKEPGQLVMISLHLYGTRVVQKLIETLKTQQQILAIVSNLRIGFLILTVDGNGNHVIQKCLENISNEHNKYIFVVASIFCTKIATHRHGCCVLQKCLKHSKGQYRDILVREICRNGLLLAQDPFGNYVVQCVIKLNHSSFTGSLISQFQGHFKELSQQKCSSHVIEALLAHSKESRPLIVTELLSTSNFYQLLQDPFANYVIKSALKFTEGMLCDSLVKEVEAHIDLLNNPFCKRIFSQCLLKK